MCLAAKIIQIRSGHEIERNCRGPLQVGGGITSHNGKPI